MKLFEYGNHFQPHYLEFLALDVRLLLLNPQKFKKSSLQHFRTFAKMLTKNV